MNSLYEEYDKVFKNKTWCYYDELEKDYKSLEDIFTSPIKFIKDYFKAGNKGSVIKPSLLDNLSNRRLAHIVSTYFLGFVLKSKFSTLKISIKNKCTKIEKVNITHEKSLHHTFIFTWFLTCLGHDYGNIIENENNRAIPEIMGDVRAESACRLIWAGVTSCLVINLT